MSHTLDLEFTIGNSRKYLQDPVCKVLTYEFETPGNSLEESPRQVPTAFMFRMLIRPENYDHHIEGSIDLIYDTTNVHEQKHIKYKATYTEPYLICEIPHCEYWQKIHIRLTHIHDKVITFKI
jgi:hypothetical protein